MEAEKKKTFLRGRATKPRGGGWLKALVAGPLRKEFFCGFPYEVQILQLRAYKKISGDKLSNRNNLLKDICNILSS